MGSVLKKHKKLVIIMTVLGVLLLAGSVLASVGGVGIDRPPSEEEQEERAVMHHSGHYWIFWGASPGGVRGVGGRGVRGGSFGAGK